MRSLQTFHPELDRGDVSVCAGPTRKFSGGEHEFLFVALVSSIYRLLLDEYASCAVRTQTVTQTYILFPLLWEMDGSIFVSPHQNSGHDEHKKQ